MHITKFKLSSMGQIFAHVNRDKNQTRKYGNADIDPRKTYRNYDLQHGDIDALQKRLEEVSHTKRHDLVACCGVVVTLPQELLKDEHGQLQSQFFEDVKKFLDDKFGKQNCIYATVHNDESTPHMHYGFVPTVVKQRKYRSADKKGQTYTQERVCAKEVVTKDMLSKLHDELQERIFARPYFRKIRVVAPIKSKRLNHNMSISELKAKTAEKLEKELANQRELTKQAEINAEEALKAHKNAQKTLADSTTLSEHLKRLDKCKITRKKGHLGRVLLTESEYNTLVDKAESVESLAQEREYLLRTASGQETRRLREEYEQMQSYHATDNLRYTRQVEKNTELQRKNTEVQREVVNLTTENEQLKKANEKLKAENLELVGQVETLKKVVKSVWTHLSDYYRELCESLGIRQSRGYHR